MSLVETHRFTVEEFQRMGETGIIKPDARVELLNGRIIDMSPIGSFHGGATNQLQLEFAAQSKGRYLAFSQHPLALDEHTELQPDVMLLRPSENHYKSRIPAPEDVILVIEVSDTTLAFDQGEKLAAYGKSGIPEYWIVNRRESVFEVHREPHFTGFATTERHAPGTSIQPAEFPDVSIDVAAFL